MMNDRAPDIVELEKFLNGGEGDDVLSVACINIAERLLEKAQDTEQIGTPRAYYALQEDHQHFRALVSKILGRRHSRVLEQYFSSNQYIAYLNHNLLGP